MLDGIRKKFCFLGSLNSLNKKYDSGSPIISLLLIILLVITFTILGMREINMNTDPEGYDTTGYLGEANLIKNNGGVTSFLELALTGQYKQANQHPLYILVITPLASTDISFFINAKIVSFIIGLILVLCLYVIGRKMYGDICASIAVMGLVLNTIFLKWTSLVASESLLMLLSFLCMYFIIKGFRDNRYWALAGAFAGLAYLTKGTALFLIPGFGLSALIIYRLNIFRNKYFWAFFALFILISSPLFIRNLQVYGTPLYNVNNNIISIDQDQRESSIYQTFNLEEGAGIPKFDQGEINFNKFQSESSTADSLILFDLPGKITSGILPQGQTFFRSLNILPTKMILWGKLELVFGLFLFSLFILGVIREKNLGGMLYVVTTLLIFLVCLSFFRPLDRYWLSVIPIVWIYIALGGLTVLDLINRWFSPKNAKINLFSYIPYLLIIIFVTMGGGLFSAWSISSPKGSVEYSESRFILLNWLRANLKEGEKYASGPNFNWQLEKGTWILPPKDAKLDMSKFNSFIKKHNVSYVILDWESLTRVHSPIDKSKLVEGHFDLDPKRGIIKRKVPDGWVLVYEDQKEPVKFLVYKITE